MNTHATSTHRRQPRRFNNHEGHQPPSIKIRVTNLPPGFTAPNLYDYFSKFGDVEFVKIEHGGQAVLTYNPPPRNTSFIDRTHVLVKEGVKREVYLAPLRHTLFPVPSPLDSRRKLPAQVSLLPVNAVVGVATGEHEMIALRAIETDSRIPHSQMSLGLRIDGDRSDLTARIPVAFGTEIIPHYLQIKFAYIQKVHIADGHNGSKSLVFTFRYPPKFSRLSSVRPSMSSPLDDQQGQWTRGKHLRRVTDIDSDVRARIELPISLVSSTAFIDLGRWLTWSFVLDNSSWNRGHHASFEDVLRAYNVNIVHAPHNIRAMVGPMVWNSFDSDHHTDAGPKNVQNALSMLHHHASGFPALSFDVRYRLGVCMSKGLLFEGDINKDFISRLAEVASVRALDLLDNLAAADRKLNNPMDLFNLPELRTRRRRRVPKTCTAMHSVTITPTTLYIQPVQTEVSNRVIRKFSDLSDRFLRVRFTDELYYGSLQAQQGNADAEVHDRVRRALVNGIRIAGRDYTFLACGNSQFREHGAYFFCQTGCAVTVNSIRQWMGYFQHIREIPKYISRIGQCFSTTRAISSIGYQPSIIDIPDVVRNSYTFTDGVGKLSPFLAHMISQELRLGPIPPSVFQFRMGGCKGVLAVDPHLTERTVCIRPSQKKFITDFNQLEIIRTSSFQSPYLNRQLILVLSALGISDDVFIDMLHRELEDIDTALKDDVVAIAMLQRNVDFNQITTVLARMIALSMRNDPFVDSMIHLWRAWMIKWLKEKANLFVQEGAFVLGCVDESATLQPTEIFIQVPDTTSDRGGYKVIEGECIIARNPALHPGDIRTVRAVACPALQHLRDVVVLSQLGDRDLANMCAGGDLDGDDFLVIWDPVLIPKEQHAPMDYKAPPPVTSHGPVTQSDIIKFFCDYMKNNSLGSIAVAHRAWADYHSEGVKNEQCIQLAHLHSLAVDYPKTGVPAIMAPHLKVQRYPHWLNKKFNTYKSHKVLGKLYDQSQRDQSQRNTQQFEPQYHRGFDKRILMSYDRLAKLPDDIKARMVDLKAEYDEDLRRIMAQYGVQTEFEIWTAFVLEHNREIKDYKFAEEIGRLTMTLKHHYRDLCFELLGITSTPIDRDQTDRDGKLGSCVAALYKLTADEVYHFTASFEHNPYGSADELQDDSLTPMLSFPWIFIDELLALATMGDNEPGMTLAEAMTRNNIAFAHKAKSAAISSDRTRFDRMNEADADSCHAQRLSDTVGALSLSSRSGSTSPRLRSVHSSPLRSERRSSPDSSASEPAVQSVNARAMAAIVCGGGDTVENTTSSGQHDEEAATPVPKSSTAFDKLAAMIGMSDEDDDDDDDDDDDGSGDD